MDGGNSMADMGTKAAAEKWGVSQKAVEAWCRRISKTVRYFINFKIR